MTISPETDRPTRTGVDSPTAQIRVPDTTLAETVEALCLCSHARSAHPGGRCRCCGTECASWRPRVGRRHSAVFAVAHELTRMPPPVAAPPVPHLGWTCTAPRRPS